MQPQAAKKERGQVRDPARANAPADWDQESEHFGVPVFVDSKSAVYLAGSSVDYVDDLNGSGFKIENPNAASTCGCGESFGA